ncbi:hypothetical protein P6F26_10255 [Roseibacterium sp. SDUM158017]|uniref:hypothetical protein n=1 Tax=Roseicyclus salinarum TaxID=3036773 RepID=UPI002414E7B2|nr:hypothetical protein [Roseibacterium sp. SDUM158017]MDG4648825.1 hypothetical protein [Roseibacterium sp. SDUM158017]
MLTAGPSAAQGLLDRVQGLYHPQDQGAWTCGTLGMDGGAVGVIGQTLHGVENSCALENPFPVPGMDAMAFDLACTGEGTTYDGGRAILVPLPDGLGIVRDGSVVIWTRCP